MTRAATPRLARLRRVVRLQRAAAIGYHHKMAGHEQPTNQKGVRAVLRGIRRTIGAAREGKAPASADVLKQMLALCPTR